MKTGSIGGANNLSRHQKFEPTSKSAFFITTEMLASFEPPTDCDRVGSAVPGVADEKKYLVLMWAMRLFQFRPVSGPTRRWKT